MGPTASGKSDLGLKLSATYPVEIISVDAAMVYKHMDIGTAKPTADERAAVSHHLIDILDPIETFSAAQFCSKVHVLIKDIRQRNKIPILLGGTMMYFKALQHGLTILPSADYKLRAHLLERAQQSGWNTLYSELTRHDPVSAAKIHAHDTQRIQRALEIVYLTGFPVSWLHTKQTPAIEYKFINLILYPEDRSWLHQRIEERFILMLEHDLIAEVQALVQQWPITLQHPALRTVGY